MITKTMGELPVKFYLLIGQSTQCLSKCFVGKVVNSEQKLQLIFVYLQHSSISLFTPKVSVKKWCNKVLTMPDNILYYISINIICIGTTLTLSYGGKMWFHHIPKWTIFIEDKSSILTFQNHINYGLNPHCFLLYEVAQNDPVFWTISNLMSHLWLYNNKIKYSPIICSFVILLLPLKSAYF